MNYLNHRLHLDPESEAGLGGSAPSDSAPALEVGASAAPSFDPNAFRSEITGLIRNEFGGIRREFESSRTPAPQAQEEKAPTIQSFYNSKGELDEEGFSKFLQAQHKYLSKSERAEWEKEYTQKQSAQQSQSSFRKVQAEHVSRESEYEKTNPTYHQDLMAAGDLEVNPSVGQRILASKYSANIIHYFAKNRAEFVKFQAESYDDPAGAIETLGELRARFSTASTTQKIPPQPTRRGFGTGGSKEVARSTKEIIDEWRS